MLAGTGTHRMMSVYSRSFPLLSFHFLYITEASTLAGEKVLGSFSREITLRRMVLWGRGTSSVPQKPWGPLTGGATKDGVQGVSGYPRCKDARSSHLTFCVGFHRSEGSSPL